MLTPPLDRGDDVRMNADTQALGRVSAPRYTQRPCRQRRAGIMAATQPDGTWLYVVDNPWGAGVLAAAAVS
jgi:hypothetical protein